MVEENVGIKVGLSGILGVVFIILKLCGVIDWSWLWVLSPFWIPVVFWLIILLIAMLLGHF